MPSHQLSVSDKAISKQLGELPPSFMVLKMLKPADRLSYLDKMFQPTVAIPNATTNGSFSAGWAQRSILTAPFNAGGTSMNKNMVVNLTDGLKH